MVYLPFSRPFLLSVPKWYPDRHVDVLSKKQVQSMLRPLMEPRLSTVCTLDRKTRETIQIFQRFSEVFQSDGIIPYSPLQYSMLSLQAALLMLVVYRQNGETSNNKRLLTGLGGVKKGRLVGGPGPGLNLVMVFVAAFTVLAGMGAALAGIVKRLTADLAGGGFPVDLGKGQFSAWFRHNRCNNARKSFQHNK